MIALDTNVLVRLALYDDEPQAKAAERLLVRARREQTELFVADVVLCEFVSVLARRVGMSRDEIATAWTSSCGPSWSLLPNEQSSRVLWRHTGPGRATSPTT